MIPEASDFSLNIADHKSFHSLKVSVLQAFNRDAVDVSGGKGVWRCPAQLLSLTGRKQNNNKQHIRQTHLKWGE